MHLYIPMCSQMFSEMGYLFLHFSSRVSSPFCLQFKNVEMHAADAYVLLQSHSICY